MSNQRPTVVCAWCNRTITKASAGSLVSHGICQSCMDWTFTHSQLDVDLGPALPADDYVAFPPRGDQALKH